MPDDVIISSDIGNNCAIGNAYPTGIKCVIIRLNINSIISIIPTVFI
jgi:hypothetical protein